MKKKLSLFMAIVMMLSVFSFNVVAMAAEEVNGPFAFIESHPQNAAFSGNSVDVTGWALKTEGTVSKIDMTKTSVTIGGTAATATVVPVSRPDVKEAFAGKNLPDAIFGTVGFKATVDISGVTAGTESHVLKLTFNDSTGAMIVSKELNFTKAAKEIKPNLLNIDLPTANAQIGEATFDVSGWALASKDGETDAIAKIGVKVGSAAENFLAATDRFERTDVKSALTGYPEASYANAGFKYTANSSDLNATGATTVAVTTYDSADTAIRTLHLSVMKVAPGNKELLAVIDSPKAGDKFINSFAVSGWAFLGVNNADGIAKVKVVATDSEGTQKTAEFTKNVARTDLTKDVIKGYPDASYVTPGFTSGAIDISNLKNGKVTVVTYLLDAAGNTISGSFGGSTVDIEKATTAPKDTIVIIDAPANGTVVADGKLSVSGWALATANGTASNIDAITVKVEGAATETPVTATATRIARTDITETVVPGYGDYANAGYEAKDINLASFADGKLTLTVAVTHKDASPSTVVSREITKATEVVVINVESLKVVNETTIVAAFDKAPETAFTAADFDLKVDTTATPTTAKAISKVVSSVDKKSYTLTVSAIAVDSYVSLAPKTSKFSPAVTIVKFVSKYAVNDIKVISATEVTVILTTPSATAIANTAESIKSFAVLYEQTAPVANTFAIVPTALVHVPSISPDKVALTISGLEGTIGTLKINGATTPIDFHTPLISDDTVTRTSTTTGKLSVTSKETASGYIRYILDATGTLTTAPEITAFATLGTNVKEAVLAVGTTNVVISGLTAGTAAKLFVVYADSKDGSYATANKTAVKTYTIQAPVQPATPGRSAAAGINTVGTIATTGSSTYAAYVKIADVADAMPNVGDTMPVTGGFAVAAGAQLTDKPAKIDQYIMIYEAKGTSAADSTQVGFFSATKITQSMLKTPVTPVIGTGVIAAAGKTISSIDGTILSSTNIKDCKLYASKAISATEFVLSNAYELEYHSTQTEAILPSNITDGTGYFLYLVHTASGKASSPSINSFTVDSAQPVITVIESKTKRTSDTTADITISVNKDIMASATEKIGIMGSMSKSGFTDPVAGLTNATVVKDSEITIKIKGTPITTGHGIGIGALEAGEHLVTLQVIDQAGNKSEPKQVTLAPFVLDIPANKTYTVKANGDGTDLATDAIQRSADGSKIYVLESGKQTATAFTDSAASFTKIMKLLSDGALKADDTFIFTADQKISAITKNSTEDSKIKGLVDTDVADPIVLTNAVAPTTTGTTPVDNALIVEGTVGTKKITANATATGAIINIAGLTSGKVSTTGNARVSVKASTQVFDTTAASSNLTINDVTFNTSNVATVTVNATTATANKMTVTSSQSTVGITAESTMTVPTEVAFTTTLQAGALTVTGQNVGETAKMLKVTANDVYAAVTVLGGLVDVSGVAINSTFGTQELAIAPTKEAKVTAGTKAVTIAATQIVTLVSSGAAEILSGSSEVKLVEGTIASLKITSTSAPVTATTTTISGKVTIAAGLTVKADFKSTKIGSLEFGPVASNGQIILNPENKTFVAKAGIAGKWDVDDKLNVFGGKDTVISNGVTLTSSTINNLTLSGTPTATTTFYAYKATYNGFSVKVTATDTTIAYAVTTQDTSLSAASNASASVVSTSNASKQSNVSMSEASAGSLASLTSTSNASRESDISMSVVSRNSFDSVKSNASLGSAMSRNSLVSMSTVSRDSVASVISNASLGSAISKNSLVSMSAVSRDSVASVISNASLGSAISKNSLVSMSAESEESEALASINSRGSVRSENSASADSRGSVKSEASYSEFSYNSVVSIENLETRR